MKNNAENDQPCMVSIVCDVFNHEPYLRDCLEGFVKQVVDFPYEILIHDDCSTDKSVDIIKEYVAKYPHLFKPIYQKENQYSQGVKIWGTIQFPRSQGKYIAICEGDDYWTDPNKLQRQVEFLESHPTHSATADNGLIRNELTGQEYPFNNADSHDVTMEEIIVSRRFPTAGVVCRRAALNGYNETCHVQIDTILWCWLLSKGKMRYNRTISSVYRKGEQGMTVYTEPFAFARKIEIWNNEILRVFDVKRSFMYLHIAKIYKSFIRPSLQKRHPLSALKCIVRGGFFTIKAVMHKFIS